MPGLEAIGTSARGHRWPTGYGSCPEPCRPVAIAAVVASARSAYKNNKKKKKQ